MLRSCFNFNTIFIKIVLIPLKYMKFTLISAGQTGADMGALLAAKELNLNIKGYVNKGWRNENGLPSCASTDQKESGALI